MATLAGEGEIRQLLLAFLHIYVGEFSAFLTNATKLLS